MAVDPGPIAWWVKVRSNDGRAPDDVHDWARLEIAAGLRVDEEGLES